MIILDGPLDPPKRRLSQRPSLSISDVDSIRSSEGSPPSYRSNGSRHSIQPMLDSELPSRSPSKLKEKKKESRWRTWLLYSLALYAVVTIAVAVPYFVTQKHRMESRTAYQRMKPPDPSENSPDPDPGLVPPVNVPAGDGTVLGCNVWDYSHDYGYPDNMEYARHTYCIPHNSTSVWIHALGGAERFVSGSFIVKLNPDEAELDYMVDIMLTYPTADTSARDSSAICLMQDSDVWGIGIYTPPNSTNHTLDYQLTFLVPHQAKAPLSLSQFTTYLPWFSHSFQDLNGSLIFGNVDIGGIASPVDGVINAETVNVTTSYAPITGSYRATDTLILQTSYAKIDTNITLSNIPDQEGTTSLFMKSSEGPFSATVNLASSGLDNSTLARRDDPRPQYSTRVSCDDSPVTLIFRHDDTVDSSDLDVQVNTTLNRAVVLLDTKFEGNFDLYSANGSVFVTDLDGDEHTATGELMGPLPHYRRSLEYKRESSSRASGCVKRGDTMGPPPPPPPDQKVNVHVQNHLALVALGFIKPGDNTPSIADLGLT